MTGRNGLRRRLGVLPVAVLLTAALPASGALAQAPGLPRTYNATPVDSQAPVNGAAFGWGIYSADLTGDGKQDLLVAQGQQGIEKVPTQVFIYDGSTGKHIDTIKPPEENPKEPLFPTTGFDPNTTPIPPPTEYRSPEMAFVYVETMPDLGSCPSGDGPDADKICDDKKVGDPDGIPEIIVGSRALRVNTADGSQPATLADPTVGRGYVFDGKTRAVIKRIDMPQRDRADLKARGTRRSFTNNMVTTEVDISTTGAAFGRTMASPQGMPPCAGLASENNDTGVGPCPALTRGTGTTTTGSTSVTNVTMPDAKNTQMIVGPGIPRGARITEGGGSSTVKISAAATASATVALTATDPRYSQAVRIGDLNEDGWPDLVVTARGWLETSDVIRNDGTVIPGSAPAGTHCRTTAARQPAPTVAVPNPPVPKANTCSAGKVWAYSGKAIAGSDPTVILETTLHAPTAAPDPATPGVPPPCVATPPCRPNGGIQNPDAQASPAGGENGGNLFRVGDLAGNDGVPDFVIPYRGADFPLKSPDLSWGLNMGSAYLFNGRTGALDRTLVSPEPQQRSTFSGGFNAGRAVGDLGATDTPDMLLAAPFQNQRFADEGRFWVFNGDTSAGGGGEQSWNFAMLNDPEPYIGGNFGGAQTGIGDVVGGPGAPGNEVLVGGFRFDNFTEASQFTVPDVNIMNGTLDKNLMTIPHPEGKTGDGFGVGMTPMGDINKDGFLDFAVSAYFTDVAMPNLDPPCCAGLGRAWIFTSDNSPPPPPPAQPAASPITPASAGVALKAGACTNRTVGTDRGEMLKGTLAGDTIFGFAGDDTLMGYQGEDCINAGPGDDKIMGGDARDKLIGVGGADVIYGEDGRDDLFGGFRDDRLYGGFGRDMISGGVGNDLVVGGADADRLYGDAGKDRLIGGDGRNHIDGGGGNDSIDSFNGETDRVKCGKGNDKVTADAADRLNSCERVTIRKSKRATR